MMELLSTQGNLAPGHDGPFTHLHTLMSDNGHTVHGGHLYHATIHVVGEIHLRVLDANAMKREPTNTDFVALKFCDLE
jgi:predicted DNA-binding protein with PD1-like motif